MRPKFHPPKNKIEILISVSLVRWDGKKNISGMTYETEAKASGKEPQIIIIWLFVSISWWNLERGDNVGVLLGMRDYI
jgi:hypothetical protein